MERYLARLGGREHDTGHVEAVTNPYDGSTVAQVTVGDRGDMEAAIEHAHAAFASVRRLPTHVRVRALERLASRIESEADALARLMALESGKPIRFCRGEVARGVITFRLGAVEAQRATGEVLPVDLEARAEGRLCLYRRVPRGPVAAISPFNFPLNLIAHKLSPALAIGTSTVLKPPPQCPLTAHVLGAWIDELELPGGICNVLHCPPEVAQIMVADPRMKVLSFTGSEKVGWELKRVASDKQVLLELGGNAPCILDRGIAFEQVRESLLGACWANAGQVCIKVQRILVHQDDYETFVRAFVAATQEVACGDPLLEETIVGPVIEPQHVQRIMSWIDEAKRAGAKVQCGDRVEGSIVYPTVLTNVPDTAKVLSEEVFGPVTVVEPYARYEDALARCNATRFGLQVGVFTHDIGKAMQAYEVLDYGGVMINEVPTFRVDNFPYGGTKASGFGREGVAFAADEMTEPRVLVMRGL